MAIRFEQGLQIISCSYCGVVGGVSTKTMRHPQRFAELMQSIERKHAGCRAKHLPKTLKERAWERLQREMRAAGLNEQEQKFFQPLEKQMAEHFRTTSTA